MKAIVATLVFLVGTVAGQLFFCYTPKSAPFMMTAEAKLVFEGWSGKTLRVWGATNNKDAKCIDLVLNYSNKSYQVYSQKDDKTGQAQATAGTFTYSRSLGSTYLKFKQTTGPNTGLFQVNKDSEWTWYVSHLTDTDIVLGTCGVDFFGWYDQLVLSTEDLTPVSTKCFKDALSRTVGYSDITMQKRNNCTAYSTS